MEKVLNVKNLRKYFGKSLILDDVNLNVYKGEIMGFLGPNGAGKTTAIKIVLGFLSADGGEFDIDGINTKYNYEGAMALCGGIVENPDMYKQFSGQLNLELYARTHGNISKERIAEVVEIVGLTNRINDKVKKYSLGMKQRLGLAQAMLAKPKLLILDEPTNGLDPQGIKDLRDVLKRLAREEGVGVLVSSHQLFEMQEMCDRVTIISKGKIICEKSVEELEVGDNTTFKVKVDNKPEAVRILTEYKPTVDQDTGEITISLVEEDAPKAIAALVNGGILVYEFKEARTSLESAYIEITGGAANV